MFVLVFCIHSDLFDYLLDTLCVAFGSCLKFHQQEYTFQYYAVLFFPDTQVTINMIAVEETSNDKTLSID